MSPSLQWALPHFSNLPFFRDIELIPHGVHVGAEALEAQLLQYMELNGVNPMVEARLKHLREGVQGLDALQFSWGASRGT